MQQSSAPLTGKTALITGAAQRVGAAIVRALHARGCNIALHYRNSADPARALQEELLAGRPDSVALLKADLLETANLPALVEEAHGVWGTLDVLVNNASGFYPTPVGTVTEGQWDELMGSNLKAPFFLAQAAAPHLKASGGCIVNLVDIHAERPLAGHPVYCASKAGLAMLTRSLARELGPEVRVNGVSPGAILWPAEGLSEESKQNILAGTALKRKGDPEDIADAVRFLVEDAGYITGHVLAVDGGRSVVG